MTDWRIAADNTGRMVGTYNEYRKINDEEVPRKEKILPSIMEAG